MICLHCEFAIKPGLGFQRVGSRDWPGDGGPPTRLIHNACIMPALMEAARRRTGAGRRS